ncbi:MAG: ribbon-helix-helix domain-containing protein [Candidatus Thermoplasmatota archaeon]|jgi:Arc/MetJ-type ribon-helix-helix transcriptional regulator|nr:ribbon-helix-helix domain-containing protein [Candidatus Thermoplasmatota archaeon]
MGKKTIQIRIDEDTYKFVNKLIRSGLFKTKSEALRYILSMGITAAEKFPEVFEKVERLTAIERSTGRNPILLSGGLTYLLANRDRFS